MYDKELKELRKQVKVGLIPPFYADLPTTFEEICDSEKAFILSYMKSPIRTQLLYLGKIASNIMLKGARDQ